MIFAVILQIFFFIQSDESNLSFYQNVILPILCLFDIFYSESLEYNANNNDSISEGNNNQQAPENSQINGQNNNQENNSMINSYTHLSSNYKSK